ncbi:AraC family transcriptional regulator [Cohnella sp. GCM10027633]|uniref:AraC family transcriptional regulator n=1 Tax=unclassified Cohnella TaxID=2636738 RepID=UPI0036419102
MKGIEHLDLLGRPLQFHYRLSSDTSFEAFHAHAGLEILYVHNGEGMLEVDGHTFELNQGMISIFQPLRLHHIRMKASSESPYVRTVLVLDPGVLEPYWSMYPELRSFFRSLLDHDHRPLALAGSERFNRSLELLFEQWSEQRRTHSSFDRQAPAESSFIYLMYLLQHLKTIIPLSERDQETIRPGNHAERIREWLDEHYHAAFRLERLADALHLSPYYVSRVFKEASGVTITEYVLAQRMRMAGLLLRSSSLGIQEIARKTGYPSESYFVRTFKRYYGKTPLQFRRSDS